MRDFKGMKRQRGRNRGGGQSGGQGGGKPQHNINRAFDSNGPDNIKIRGHAQHVYEKYQQLARDASSAGDRVLAENYLQHAEHYFRTLRAIQPNRPASEIVSRDTFASGYDIDFEDQAAETAMEEADAQAAERAANPQSPQSAPMNGAGGEGEDGFGGQNGQGQHGQGQNGQGGYQRRDREDRFRDRDRPQGERQGGEEAFRRDRLQNDRAQNDRPQNDRSQSDRDDRYRDRSQGERAQGQNAGQNAGPNAGPGQTQGQNGNGEFRDRGDRPRYRDRDDRYREPRPEGEAPRAEGDRPRDREFRRDRFERGDRPERSDRYEPRADAVAEPAAPAPADEPAQVLRSQDGGFSEAPAFLQAAAPSAPPAAAAIEDAEPRVRRPRARRKPADAPAEIEEA